MANKLGGILFVYNGLTHDYCFLEAIQSMLPICDTVYVLDAGSLDGTREALLAHSHPKVKVIFCTHDEWASISGKEKLSHFTNRAIEVAQNDGCDWILSVQADEVLHEKSYSAIYKAMDSPHEAIMCSRVNLWGSPYTQLDVPHNRKPCSTEIVRLAKSYCRAYDDAESLASNNVDFSFLQDIRIYHMGFVRKREVMVEKIRHIQQDVFGMTPDEKLKGMTVFQPWAWFDKIDVRLIDEPLPSVIQDWAKQRVYK